MNSGENTTIPVEIDRELSVVVPGFLENRQLDCGLIERLLAEGAMSEIRTLGHRMKGSGGSYGFDEISEIGEALECAALMNDAAVIRSAISQLKDYLSRVLVTYI